MDKRTASAAKDLVTSLTGTPCTMEPDGNGWGLTLQVAGSHTSLAEASDVFAFLNGFVRGAQTKPQTKPPTRYVDPFEASKDWR